MGKATVKLLALVLGLVLGTCQWGWAQGKDNMAQMVNAGYDLLEKGKTQDAQKVYEDVLKKYPNNAIALNNLGAIMAHKGKYDEAIVFLERALAHARGYRVTLDRVCDPLGTCAAFRLSEDPAVGEDLDWLIKRNILTVKMAQAGQGLGEKRK